MWLIYGMDSEKKAGKTLAWRISFGCFLDSHPPQKNEVPIVNI